MPPLSRSFESVVRVYHRLSPRGVRSPIKSLSRHRYLVSRSFSQCPRSRCHRSLAPRTFIQPTPTKLRTHRIKSQTMIANFPDVLCIQLKRFSYDRLSHTATKLDTSILVEPDKILDLSSLHYSTWLGVDNLSISFRYRLVSLCLHLSDKASSTSRINGHCVCLYRTDHQRWFLSDDERITEITQADHFFQTPYVTQNCYLLFYERCS